MATNVIRDKKTLVSADSVVSSGKAADILNVSQGTIHKLRADIPHIKRMLHRVDYLYKVRDLVIFAQLRNLELNVELFTSKDEITKCLKEASTVGTEVTS